MSAFAERASRADFAVFRPVQTRWADDDAYGHVNNVVYYAWFDTVVNGWLIEQGLLSRQDAEGPIFLVAETGCRYFASVAFPNALQVGLAVERLGDRSVTYALAVFIEGDDRAVAVGRFVHVCVDRTSRRPVAIPPPVRAVLAALERR